MSGFDFAGPRVARYQNLICALDYSAAGADYIVSGDKRHVLSLRKVRGVQVVPVREFLALPGIG